MEPEVNQTEGQGGKDSNPAKHLERIGYRMELLIVLKWFELVFELNIKEKRLVLELSIKQSH